MLYAFGNYAKILKVDVMIEIKRGIYFLMQQISADVLAGSERKFYKLEMSQATNVMFKLQ